MNTYTKRNLFAAIVCAIVSAICISLALTGCGGPAGPKGERGEAGPQGPKGDPGQNGVSCTVQPTNDGLLMSCTDGTQAAVTNGTVLETIQLCPNVQGGTFKEYAVRIGEHLYAVYASGTAIGWTRLIPGTYRTTDGRNCLFTVTQDNQVVY